jgi:hypothetical protein
MGYFTRRSFVKVGSLSTFGFLGLGDVLRMQAESPAPVRKDISIIHLWLTGGVSQLDTWDPKPEADARYRSPFDALETKASGMRISGQLPKIAAQANKFVIIRSVTHKQAAHEAAKNMVQSGHNPLPTIQFPSVQTVVAKELGKRGEVPPVIAIPGASGSWDKAGFLGTQYNPFDVGSPNVENYKVRDLDLPMGVDWSRVDRRRSLLSLVDEKFRKMDTSGILENMDAYYQMAFQLMHSEKAKKAFRIEEEPEALRDKYGRTSLGQGSLLARRMIEAGARFVTVSSGNWDHHRDIFPALKNAEIDATEPVRVGLRPFRRGGVRLEAEAGTRIVHNYGHGGSGVTLSWGCALEVAEHVERLLRDAVTNYPVHSATGAG